MNLVLLGPPGAGKGTQGLLIQKKFGLRAISTGDLVRKEIKERTPLGLEIEQAVNQGQFPKDEVILELAEKAIRTCSTGFICDGFPRTLNQAQKLETFLATQRKQLTRVIEIRVDFDLLVKRLTGRMTCETCGAIYNIYFTPPRKEKVCDKCGGRSFLKRKDDQPDTVKNRLEIYKAQTLPLVDFYQERGLLTTVDGMKEASEVFQEIEKILLAVQPPKKE